jgi:hypothetical protein
VQQVHLAEAFGRLAQGDAVGEIAAALGYASPSAFSAMFRRILGKTPQHYLTEWRSRLRCVQRKAEHRACTGLADQLYLAVVELQDAVDGQQAKPADAVLALQRDRAAEQVSRSAAGTPGPVSATVTSTLPCAAGDTVISTSPPAGVWRIALSNRLVSTRSIMPRSARTIGAGCGSVAISAVPLLRLQFEFLEHVLYQVGQRERLQLRLHRAVFQPRQFKQGLRQTADLAALRQRDAEVALALCGVQRFILQRQRFKVAVHGAQRRAQVVRDIGHHFAAVVIQLAHGLPLLVDARAHVGKGCSRIAISSRGPPRCGSGSTSWSACVSSCCMVVVRRRSGRVIRRKAIRPAASTSAATTAIDHKVVRSTELAVARAASRSCSSLCRIT